MRMILSKCICGSEAATGFMKIHGYQVYCTNPDCPYHLLIMDNMDTQEKANRTWENIIENKKLNRDAKE